jgi:Transglycosylase-like domain
VRSPGRDAAAFNSPRHGGVRASRHAPPTPEKGFDLIRRFALFISIAGALAVPGVASAESLTHHANHLRAEVVRAFGSRTPGRDIVRRGILEHGKTRRATHAELISYRDALARMLASTSPASTSAGYSSADSTTSSASAAAAASLPTCTWQPESGGDWSAVNPSSGAGGRYQIMPSTWAAYGGTGLPQDASPAEQTAIAVRIMQSQGPSAWVNC